MTLTPELGQLLLKIVLWLPLVGAIVIALIGGAGPRWAWRIGVLFSGVPFLLTLWLMWGFDRANAAQMQFYSAYQWIPIPFFNSEYRIGVDGISMPLLLLNTLLSFSAIAGSWRISNRPP